MPVSKETKGRERKGEPGVEWTSVEQFYNYNFFNELFSSELQLSRNVLEFCFSHILSLSRFEKVLLLCFLRQLWYERSESPKKGGTLTDRSMPQHGNALVQQQQHALFFFSWRDLNIFLSYDGTWFMTWVYQRRRATILLEPWRFYRNLGV